MIKLFEQFNNEQEIHEICKEYNIENYTINSDGSIDVNETVDLSGLLRDRIPIKFNVVRGDFYCYNNKLTSLINSPRIVDGIFSCSMNKLTSLEGSPERVGDYFYCSHNQITSLKGAPVIIEESFDIRKNPISIIDSSIKFKGDVHISHTNFDNKIKSLSQEKLRILFEHGTDYNIFDKDGSINNSRLERMFKDFNI